MRHKPGVVSPLAIVLTVVVCAFAASASSAFATISIEPLNSKVGGSNNSDTYFGVGGPGSSINFSCEKTNLEGASNATKTNYVNVTPAFTGCKNEAGETVTVAVGKPCTTKTTVSWTLTLTSVSGNLFKGGVTLNCPLTMTFHPDGLACVLSAASQTSEKESGLYWSNAKEGTKTVLEFVDLKLEYEPVASGGCATLGLKHVPTPMFIETQYTGISIELYATS